MPRPIDISQVVSLGPHAMALWAVNEGGCLLAEPICIGVKCMPGEVLDSLPEQPRDYLNNTTLAAPAESLPLDKTGMVQKGVRYSCRNGPQGASHNCT
jgi:hypothetical protein